MAEEYDPWAGERWAPHGDLNVPADSDSLSTVAEAQVRGLDLDRDNRKADLYAEGDDIAEERKAENEAAVEGAEKVDYRTRPQRRRDHRLDPEASEPQE